MKIFLSTSGLIENTELIEIVLRGFLFVPFSKFYIWLSRLSSKKVESNSI